MRIYITRHGETQWNMEGRMQGWMNSDLTEKGIENAKRLGESLKDVNFGCIYSSPLGRAFDTAKHIRGNKKTEIVLEDNLKEMGFGLWEGMEHSKIEELYSEERFNFWNKPHLYKPIDGESFQELFNRVGEIFNSIIMENSYENILIVSHAVVIKAIYAIVKKIPLEDFWSHPFMYDTCLTLLETSEDGIKVVLEGDTSHLD